MIYKYLHSEVEVQNLCFVIMPVNERSNRLFDFGIRPPIEATGMRCLRADSRFESVPAMLKIFDDILRAKIIIADITDSNANLYYELGLSHALKRHVILLRQKSDVPPEVPFDLLGAHYVEYELTWGGEKILRDSIKDIIAQIQTEVSESPGVKEARGLLDKGLMMWKATDEIVLTAEQFSEVFIMLAKLELTDDEIGYIAGAGAYFGRFMGEICNQFGKHRTAVNALIKIAAQWNYRGPSWRAAIMLEHCDSDLVLDSLTAYDGPIRNKKFFPEAIEKKAVDALLLISLESAARAKDQEAYKLILAEVERAFG